GLASEDVVSKCRLVMTQANLTTEDRPVIERALSKAEETGEPAAAIELSDGTIVTGKTTKLLGASSAMLLNALKIIAGIDDDIHLISPEIIEPIQKLKIDNLGNHNPRLHTDEVLIALSICALTDVTAKRAFDKLADLKDCDMHSSVILSQVDMNVLKKLGIHVTCEPKYQTKKLYHAN
ncbi:MAG: DUF1846 family protein, partial [Clostridia bacterium]|nr:DUF1846 family protein [Clostridia bacterium]